jgi:N-methylhydantoinase B
VLRPGPPNETFFDILRAGSRTPSSWRAMSTRLCACNDAGAKRLVEMMDEYAMDSSTTSPAISSTLAGRDAGEIAKLPGGTYRAEIRSDGYEAPVTLKPR